MNYPPIKSLPNDDQLRVVWSYGSIYVQNDFSTAPHALVSVKQINNGRLDDEVVYKLPLAQIDILRIGSIWKGQNRIAGFWSGYKKPYEESVFFDFDFNLDQPESIAYSDKDSLTGYCPIPPFAYPMGMETKSNIHKKLKEDQNLSEAEKDNLREQSLFLSHIFKSKLTKLISKKGCTVLIPALEVLTSCYTPKEQQLRNKIVNHPLDEVLSGYIDIDLSVENDQDEYDLYVRSKKHNTNVLFLAYAQCNAISRQRLDYLRSSILKGKQDKTGRYFPERYPDVLPYHPDKMQLSCDGIWINSHTFLALRIGAYSLPVEHKINQILLKTVYPFKDEGMSHEDTQNGGGVYENVQGLPAVLPGFDPSSNAGSAYITTEITILGQYPKIEDFIETEETDSQSRKKAKFVKQDVKGLSSGEQNSGNDSKGVGQLRQSEEEKESNRVNQLEILQLMNKALQGLLLKNKIKNIEYLDAFGDVHPKTIYGSFPRNFVGFDEPLGWVVIQKLARKKVITRAFLLIKITMPNDQVLYLFEIQRKSVREGFSGLIFSHLEGEFADLQVYNFLSTIMSFKGKFRYQVKSVITSDNNVPLIKPQKIKPQRNELPYFIKNSVLFRHHNDPKTWGDKIYLDLLSLNKKPLPSSPTEISIKK